MDQTPGPIGGSWIPYDPDTDFPIQHLPWGVFQAADGRSYLASALGEHLIDLYALARLGAFEGLGVQPDLFRQTCLNPLIRRGRTLAQAVRRRLAQLLSEGADNRFWRERAPQFLHPRRAVRLLLPVEIGDYTDFYASREHAEAVGALFRDPAQALLPNWLHLPVAYHGRASSVVVSGTPIRRPRGQFLMAGHDSPHFGPTRALDYELELALVIGRDTPLGQPVPVGEAESCVFGFLLLNDWSARDLQRWEYRPLGPFLGKNFATTASPWVVPLEALHPFRVAGPSQDDPAPLPYLRDPQPRGLNIELEAWLEAPGAPPFRICRTNARHLYWSIRQQITHHTVNGCNLRIGDLLASGTISGPGAGASGSLLEATQDGKKPLPIGPELHRAWLEDGDTLTLRGWAQGRGYRIGFGEARGRVGG